MLSEAYTVYPFLEPGANPGTDTRKLLLTLGSSRYVSMTIAANSSSGRNGHLGRRSGMSVERHDAFVYECVCVCVRVFVCVRACACVCLYECVRVCGG